MLRAKGKKALATPPTPTSAGAPPSQPHSETSERKKMPANVSGSGKSSDFQSLRYWAYRPGCIK